MNCGLKSIALVIILTRMFTTINSVDLPKVGGTSTAVMTVVKAVCNG